MSKKQWGHGFHMGMKEAAKRLPAKREELVGKWFHSFRGPNKHIVQWQGQVLSIQPGDLLLVQLFEWMCGMASNQELVKISDAIGWSFYNTSEEMIDAYQRLYRK